MRQRVGLKKIRKWRKETGLPIYGALVRGNTNHRRDLLLPFGYIVHWYRDGSMYKSDIGWAHDNADYTELLAWMEENK